MGLIERRKIKELQDTTFPKRVKEIEEICGKAIPYEVDWDSLADDAEGLNFIDNLSCHRLNMALRTICIDDMGREAVRDGLRVIKQRTSRTKLICRFHPPTAYWKCTAPMLCAQMECMATRRSAKSC
jgi:hypothetical protein